MPSSDKATLNVYVYRGRLSVCISGDAHFEGRVPMMEFSIDENRHLWLNKGHWPADQSLLEGVPIPKYLEVMDWLQNYIKKVPLDCTQETLPKVVIRPTISWETQV